MSKDDVADVLRHRFFDPESIRNIGAFGPHATSVAGSIAKLDPRTSK